MKNYRLSSDQKAQSGFGQGLRFTNDKRRKSRPKGRSGNLLAIVVFEKLLEGKQLGHLIRLHVPYDSALAQI